MSRYSPKQYAAALFASLHEATGSKRDQVIKRFAEVLVGNFDKALLPKIVMQLKKMERAKLGRHDVVLTSAKPLEKSIVAEVKKKVGENSGISEVVDSSVLGGMRVLINDELVIDGTYRAQINKMVELLTRASP